MAPPEIPKGLLVVISGPSGVGKTSIVHRLIAAFDGTFSISATTRPPTSQDTKGVDYIFIDEKAFQEWVDAGRFLEYAQVFGRSWYGTPLEPVRKELTQGKLVVLDIDVQGANQVRTAIPSVFGIFILPPSEEELLHRLRHRGREDEATIERRFAEARHEMEIAHACSAYDEFVVNDELEKAAARVIELVRARLEKNTQ
jgi:guanylate kinase